ncbi:MAG: stage II sporulation protein M [Gammaproteobacteria bacterium]|nr:stage II sporulation protein M [Gammaproteobacteria bacterium]
MKQQSFEQQHRQTWERIEQALAQRKQTESSILLADDYMLLCQHLALAKQRLYDITLIERLNSLALNVYRELYRYQRGSRFNFFSFLWRQFPLAIYRQRYFVLVATLLFLLPGLISGIWVYLDEFAIYSVMDTPQVRNVEQMYDPEARKLGRERESDTDVMMFGFYIMNNIGVAFRCFAGGLLAGIGTLLVLMFNGLHIGSVAGHLSRLEYFDTFYSFVITHGAFELTAIVFSGAAGLRLGYAVINPGPFNRISSLQIAARELIPLLYGIILMLTIAAFIEAFWSSSTVIPVSVKYTVGGLCWVLVLIYSFSGKRFESR